MLTQLQYLLCSRYHQLYEQARKLGDKLEMDMRKGEQLQLEECRFQPALIKPPKHLQSAGAAAGEARFEHLAKLPENQSDAVSTEERQAAECTFKPHLLAHYSPEKARQAPFAKPRGYSEAVERLRRPGIETEAREAEEKAAAEKRAAAAASATMKPFSFQTEARSGRKQPLLFMDVNLGPGRTGRIGLHAGDDPQMLAANFARAYQLDAEMQSRLQLLVAKYMTEVIPELASEAGQKGQKGSSPLSVGSSPLSVGSVRSPPGGRWWPTGSQNSVGRSPPSLNTAAVALTSALKAECTAGLECSPSGQEGESATPQDPSQLDLSPQEEDVPAVNEQVPAVNEKVVADVEKEVVVEANGVGVEEKAAVPAEAP